VALFNVLQQEVRGQCCGKLRAQHACAFHSQFEVHEICQYYRYGICNSLYLY
jgi:hypothetical protein